MLKSGSGNFDQPRQRTHRLVVLNEFSTAPMLPHFAKTTPLELLRRDATIHAMAGHGPF